jgi:hypothetical protein
LQDKMQRKLHCIHTFKFLHIFGLYSYLWVPVDELVLGPRVPYQCHLTSCMLVLVYTKLLHYLVGI